MPRIRELPEGVWTRIAAGEVVERPGSAVKELVENALDAGARRVRVRLWDGGRLRIVVEDDGCGIAFPDLPLALTPHATSKIAGVEDLEAIRTLGYRGEALASLTAVAGVEIRSRQEGTATGGVIRSEGGRVTEHREVNCPPGTRVQVDGLFENLPARRKFLKSAAGELRRAAACLREYAVSRPDVAFTLSHDGRDVLSTEGTGDRERVLRQLWGSEPEIRRASSSAPHLSLECWWQQRPGAGRSEVMAFVNGRAVNDPVIKGAVNAAAREMSGNWALFLSLDPSLVDVNIHPAKAEVRFRYPGEVFEALRDAAAQLTPGAAPAQLLSVPPSALPERPRSAPAAMSRGWSFQDGPSLPKRAAPTPPPPSRKAPSPLQAEAGDPAPRQTEFFPSAPVARVPAYMGQTQSGYLVFDSPEELILMDPHAAHERVEYERIRAQARGSGGQQMLLEAVPLPPTLSLEAEEHREALRSAGFDLELRDGGVYLRSVPSFSVGRIEPEALLRESLAALREGAGAEAQEVLWRAWATMACKAAVKLTSALSRQEAEALWNDLHECQQPSCCPHGRPTLLGVSAADLRRRFGRE